MLNFIIKLGGVRKNKIFSHDGVSLGNNSDLNKKLSFNKKSPGKTCGEIGGHQGSKLWDMWKLLNRRTVLQNKMVKKTVLVITLLKTCQAPGTNILLE
jgi:hypothetical protein